ncbi:PHO85 cyclin-2 [Termitomyces sp. T112]|nr:PHO85 cyclin-2 [Termitomyces sp. T112]
MSVSPHASPSFSPVHHASLVDPSRHSPILLELIDLKISRSIIEYVIDCVVDTVDYAMGRPSSTRGRPLSRRPEHAKFTAFANNVIKRAEVSTPTLLATLVYIDRAKPHLHIALEEWALERVFLGALIVASKYLNDSTLKNVHWALCTGVFGKRDVGRIEREFLDVLDFQLGITEDDLLAHHDGLSVVALPSHSHRASRGFIHPHHTHRSHARHPQPVPGLDPSSPESSSSPGSDSPRTPSTLESSPAYPPTHKGTQPQHSSKTLELLRSFPIIPIPTPAHESHNHGQFS